MESIVVGQLKRNEFDADLFESEPNEIPYFDNQKMKIVFIDAQNPSYLNSADEVLENFLRLNSSNRLNDSNLVFDYYSATLKYGYTKDLEIKSRADVWNFVTPTEIMIHWGDNSEFFLCVSCECAWEMEHGLLLVFKNGTTLTRASGHDGHLTD